MHSNVTLRLLRAPILTHHVINRNYNKALSLETMNQNIVKLQYAVRGPLVVRAAQIEAELAKGTKKPFPSVIRANLGDAQAMGQKPMTYIRQLQACAAFPDIIDNKLNFPDDVKQKATQFLGSCAGKSIGSYTMSLGIADSRKAVAKFIENRDGFPVDFNNVVLSTGASTAIKAVLQLLISTGQGTHGVMVPIPQYPLYSATLAEYNIKKVDYYLNEDDNWGLDMNELDRSLQCSKCKVKAIVVINPGNPTGQVLTLENIQNIIKFANSHNLIIFADEVYQSNIWDECSEFHSFKKVLFTMGEPYCSTQELVSFMSASKGYTGECGARGGWMELVNMDPEVQKHLYKALSAMLCPNVLGQLVMTAIASPPKPGDPSYCLFQKEKTEILCSLKERAELVEATFNQMKGSSGAMYAFPRIELPQKAKEAAKSENKAPDAYFCFKLLEECGICVVPGTGFGQRPGTYHFRTTILPQKPILTRMLTTFKTFHEKFLKEHS